MLVHHILSILGLSVCALLRMYGTELVGSIVGSELSNPLLQLRWFLKETDYYNTLLGEVVDIAFVLTFTGLRIGVGSYLLYCYFMQDTDFLGRLGGLALYGLSWLFMVNIVAFAYNKYTRMFMSWKAKRRGIKELDNQNRQSDKSEVVHGDSNHNIRARKVIHNGLTSTKHIQKKIVDTVSEQLTEDVIEFSVTRTDVITS